MYSTVRNIILITALIYSQWLSTSTKDTVYCLMGHGGYIGYRIQKLYEAGYNYVTGVGCELNSRLGLIDANKMQGYIPGYPAQLWTYGTHFHYTGVGFNPYNNAGYDPMLSISLKPHMFQEDEFMSFIKDGDKDKDVDGSTPILSNWSKLVLPFAISETSAVPNAHIGVINSVGAMRNLQQVWLASMNRAINLVMNCKDCDSVELKFSFDMSETFFYETLYTYATNTDYKSDKESLDYKILVAKEEIKDGDNITLPSGHTITVPKSYLDNLKNNFPINYEKNLRPDGSIKFEAITCDESIGLKSIPEILKEKGQKKTYKITKENAATILNSKCSKYFLYL